MRSLGAPASTADDETSSMPRKRKPSSHPAGLRSLIVTESLLQFSAAGLQALLVLYLTRHLLLPGRIERAMGLPGLRAGLEHIYGPLSRAALASALVGLFKGSQYLTSLVGGLLADRVFGRTRTITAGLVLLTVGQVLMIFETTFLAALVCLLAGIGCAKSNLSSQIGQLYARDDSRRTRAFQMLYVGVGAAVVVAPLICGTLGEEVNWSSGFAAAAIGMLSSLLVYLSGQHILPVDVSLRPGGATALKPPLARKDVIAILVLTVLLVPLALSFSANMQIFNAYLIWGGSNLRLEAFGYRLPVSWLISLAGGIFTLVLLGSFAFWRWWAKYRREPDEIIKLTAGAFVAALAPLILAAASARASATHGKVGLEWALAFQVVNEAGMVILFPVGLALYSRAAPKTLTGFMMGVYDLTFFATNILAGWLGGRLPLMGGFAFWALQAALVATGGLGLLACAICFRRVLAPT
jgi:proton-dependent oligopeptide transporter, POT family